ncbi:MAG: hypothetical protein ACRDZ2_12125, partial [Ilumatobacteraceae bacterium]
AQPTPGAFHLGSIGISVDVPTAPSGDAAPLIGLTLGQLQLPGATARDFTLAADSADDLDDVVLELVLGLVKAQAATAGGVLGALAGLVGLTPGVPPLPVDQLLTVGRPALTSWLHDVLDDDTSRAAWFADLAALLGATLDPAGDAVTLAFGIASLTVGVRTSRTETGQLTISPFLDARVGAAGRHVVASADLFASNLATGATQALTRLALLAEVGRPPGGAQPVLLDLPAAAPAPAVRVEAVRIGLALDPARRPVALVAGDRVTIGTQPTFPTLDLTSTDALMDVAGAAVDTVVDGLIARLGPFAESAKVLFGLEPPPGFPGVQRVTLAALAADPLGTICDHWSRLVDLHPDAVPVVLEPLRAALASSAATALVRGTGAPDDPWLIPLGATVALAAHRTGTVIHLAVAATTRVAALGQGCTVVDGDLRLELATIDLARGSAQVGTELSATLRLRGRGLNPPQALIDLDVAVIAADHIAVAIRWSPARGVAFGLTAPNASIALDGGAPISLPPLDALDPATLDDVAWDAVEQLVGRLAPPTASWIGELVAVLGWTGDGPRLRLADVVGPGADATASLRAWLVDALVARGERVLAFLADALLGDGELTGALSGAGTAADPLTIALGHNGPDLLAWFPPSGIAPASTRAADEIRLWRPGDASLAAASLVTALADEAALDPAVADLIWNRDIGAGIEALVARWGEGDGLIVPPATPPNGVVVVRFPEVAASQLPSALDLTALLGRAPAVVIHVAVGTSAEQAWPDADPARRLDLFDPNRSPTTFAPALATAGEWFVTLGTRAACRLASGDPDGTLGQAARLSHVLGAARTLGPAQVLVGHGPAGQACRLAAAAAGPELTDVVTTGTPLGPVSLTILDERAGGR